MKKIILDIFMTCILLLLFHLSVTGLCLHTLLGLGLALLFCLHKYLNRKWLYAIVTRRIKQTKQRLLFALDCCLLLLVLIITLSGILFLTELHRFSAYVFLLAVGLHLGLHLRFKHARICGLAALLLALCGLYTLSKPSIYSNFTEIFQRKKEISKDNKNHYGISLDALPAPAGENTLEEYLSRLFCNGCGRHCPLLAPSCGYGREMEKYAEIRYQGNESLSAPGPEPEAGEVGPADPLFLMSLTAAGGHYTLLLTNKYRKKN